MRGESAKPLSPAMGQLHIVRRNAVIRYSAKSSSGGDRASLQFPMRTAERDELRGSAIVLPLASSTQKHRTGRRPK